MILVSVVIPCRNEEKYIKDCILSLINNQNEEYQLEIIVVDGKSTDKTCQIVQSLQATNVNIKLIENQQKFTPMGLNLGVKNATGDYVLIASAHSSFSDNYISELLKERERLSADIVGGVMKTEVKNHTAKAEAIRAVLSNKFGVGNAMFRVGVTEAEKVDTVPFGLYKRKIFEEVGYYNERLIRNHDMELSKRMLAAGKQIYLIPSAECTYYARETFKEVSSNNYRNGLWNILTVKITKKFSSLSLRHFVPLAFILSLILPALFSILFLPLLYISLIILVIYLGFITTISAKIAKKKGLKLIYLVATFIVLHVSYGFGSLMGILRWWNY